MTSEALEPSPTQKVTKGMRTHATDLGLCGNRAL